MPFLISQPCDSAVAYNGKAYAVDMAFDNILDVIDITLDEALSDIEKAIQASALLIGQHDELTVAEKAAIYDIIRVNLIEQQLTPKAVATDLQGNPLPGNLADLDKDDIDTANAGYDLKFDATYIYTAFRQAYGIDLHAELGRLHWHEFSALLRDLPEDTQFSQIQQIRARPLAKVKDKNERAALKKQKQRYALPGRKVVDPLEARFSD